MQDLLTQLDIMINKTTKTYLESIKSSGSVEKLGKIRFDLAEGMFEPSRRLVLKLREIELNAITALPDKTSKFLKLAIGKFLSVLPENISIFSGADEAIEIIPRMYLDKNEVSLCLVPTFSRMITSPMKVGAKVELFPLKRINGYGISDKSFNQLIKCISRLRPKVLWICSPNNPTGVVVDLKLTKRLIGTFPKTLFVINEVYQEFYSLDHKKSAVSLHDKPNVLVIRSFSKAFGLAGMRVGYVVGHQSRILEFEEFRTMYNVSSISQTLAVEVLKDIKYVADLAKTVATEREWVLDSISSTCSNIEFITGSSTNLVLIKHKTKDLFQELFRRGAVASDWRRAEGIDGEGFVRISIGDHNCNNKIIEMMKAIN